VHILCALLNRKDFHGSPEEFAAEAYDLSSALALEKARH
jgi:hypothetical protein